MCYFLFCGGIKWGKKNCISVYQQKSWTKKKPALAIGCWVDNTEILNILAIPTSTNTWSEWPFLIYLYPNIPEIQVETISN